MTDDLRPPYRIAFDNARNPYAARNALGITLDVTISYQPRDATLTAIAGLPAASHGNWIMFTGTDAVNLQASGSAGRAILASETFPPVLGLLGTSRAYFFAHKGGTDQSGIASATATKITFGAEAYDNGSFYDTTNSRWTPPAGAVILSAALYFYVGVVDQVRHFAIIFKNGTLLKYGPVFMGSGASVCGASAFVLDVANGTDYYELYALADGAGTKTIFGGANNTYFQGWQL